jgi:hypothetical protein
MGGRRLGGPQHSHRRSSHTGSRRRSSRDVQNLPPRSPARAVPSLPPAARFKGASTAELTIHQIRRLAGPLFSMVKARETRSPSSIVSVRARSLSVLASGPRLGPADNEYWRTRDLGRREETASPGASTSPTPRRTPCRWTLFPTCSARCRAGHWRPPTSESSSPAWRNGSTPTDCATPTPPNWPRRATRSTWSKPSSAALRRRRRLRPDLPPPAQSHGRRVPLVRLPPGLRLRVRVAAARRATAAELEAGRPGPGDRGAGEGGVPGPNYNRRVAGPTPRWPTTDCGCLSSLASSSPWRVGMAVGRTSSRRNR